MFLGGISNQRLPVRLPQNEQEAAKSEISFFTGTHAIPQFDRDALIAAIRTDQEGRSTFPEFLQAARKAGVVGYDADFIGRKVTYYGSTGESYLEEYPIFEVSLLCGHPHNL